MKYPFLGYNTPGLQLGQDDWMNASTPSYNAQTQANPMANQVQPWQTDLSNAVHGNTYNALGLDAVGNYQPTGNTGFGGLSKWAAENSDLLKTGAGLITGGLGAWNGMNQNKLMRQNMNQQAGQFREQMDLSKQNLNRNIEDRQRARVASNAQAYESVDSYMKKYGVK